MAHSSLQKYSSEQEVSEINDKNGKQYLVRTLKIPWTLSNIFTICPYECGNE